MLCRHHQCHEHFQTCAAHLPHMALASGRTAPPFEVRNVRSPVCWAIAQQNLKWCSSATSACYGQNISKSVRVLVCSLVVLVPKCAKSSRCRCCGSIRRAVPKATETAENSEAEREAAWHRGCSSSSDMAEAISAVVAEWQQSFGRSQVGQVLEATQGSQGDFRWAPFTRIAELWHNWRAEAFGPITLAQVVKTSADQADLREAFKLFLIKVPHSGWEKTAIVFELFLDFLATVLTVDFVLLRVLFWLCFICFLFVLCSFVPGCFAISLSLFLCVFLPSARKPPPPPPRPQPRPQPRPPPPPAAPLAPAAPATATTTMMATSKTRKTRIKSMNNSRQPQRRP